MDFQEYIKGELLVLIPVLYVVGIILKKSQAPDKYIPLILGLSGIVLSCIWVLTTVSLSSAQEIAGAVFTAITQGILVAGATVYSNQLYIQLKKKEQ